MSLSKYKKIDVIKIKIESSSIDTINDLILRYRNMTYYRTGLKYTNAVTNVIKRAIRKVRELSDSFY